MPNLRELFLLDPDLVFLNHGSFGACPAEVLERQHSLQREMERNPVEFLGRRSGALLAGARERLAAFVGARAADLVFVTNATTAVNTLTRSLGLGPGDEVLSTDQEYGACKEAWERSCRQAGARWLEVEVPLPFRPDELVDRLMARVGPKTRVVYLSHITSTTALILPVGEVCRRLRERGVLSFVDGAHAPGQVDLSLDALGADFYAGNCHKWLCAPKGSAFLHARPEHHRLLQAPVVSWGYCAEISGHTGFDAYTGSSAMERRLQWQGTRDLSAFLAVPAAIDFLERHDWGTVRRACHGLAMETLERLGALTHLAPIASDRDFGQMVAAPIPACDPEALRRTLLDRFHIEVPITTHRDRTFVRASLQGYNTRADADALVAALAQILR